MKNLLIVAMLLASTAAFAADGSVAATSTPPAQGAGAGNGQGPGANREERFEEAKARILARLHEKEACVQAATNKETLKACMPHMGERGGQGGDAKGNNGVGGGFGGGRWGNRGGGNNGTGAAPGNSGTAPGQQ
jgi:hypothetical protein